GTPPHSATEFARYDRDRRRVADRADGRVDRGPRAQTDAARRSPCPGHCRGEVDQILRVPVEELQKIEPDDDRYVLRLARREREALLERSRHRLAVVKVE